MLSASIRAASHITLRGQVRMAGGSGPASLARPSIRWPNCCGPETEVFFGLQGASPVDSGRSAEVCFVAWTINSARRRLAWRATGGGQVRVHFTADDLARTRFSEAPAPLVETWLAMVELRRAGVGHGRARTRLWLREAQRAFPPTARPLLDLLGPRGPWPGFIDSRAPDVAGALESVGL